MPETWWRKRIVVISINVAQQPLNPSEGRIDGVDEVYFEMTDRRALKAVKTIQSMFRLEHFEEQLNKVTRVSPSVKVCEIQWGCV